MNHNLGLIIPLATFKPDCSLGRFLLILLLITLALKIIRILTIKFNLLIDRSRLLGMVPDP